MKAGFMLELVNVKGCSWNLMTRNKSWSVEKPHVFLLLTMDL